MGVAVFGTLMSSGLQDAILKHLPAEIAAHMPAGGHASTESVLDPSQLQKLPAPVVQAIREGLADRLHIVFTAGIPVVAAVFLVTLFIKELPLRTHHGTPEEAGKELLDTMAQSSPESEDDLDDELDALTHQR